MNYRVVTLALLVVTRHLVAEEPVPSDRPIEEVIDHYVDLRLAEAGVTAAPQADDATVVRRLTLDLAGRIPTAEEAREYVASNDRNKLELLIERLLASSDFVRYSAVQFDDMLRGYSDKAASLRPYLQMACVENRSWERIFRELLGNVPDATQANQFLISRLGDHDALVRDISSTFFGINIECARCHDHPHIEDFTQDYYYGMRSFVNRLHVFQQQLSERQFGVVRFRPLHGDERESRLLFLTGLTFDEPPSSSMAIKETVDEENKRLEELNRTFKERKQFPDPPAFSRRAKLVEAGLSDGGRDLLAASLVNRFWARYLGRGLVSPLDQMHNKNSPSHEALLKWLTRDTREHGFDWRRLARGIVSSRTYLRGSRWEPTSGPDPSLFAVAQLRPQTRFQYSLSLRLAGDAEALPANLPAEQRAQRLEQLEKESELFAKHVAALEPGDQAGIAEASRFSNDQEILEALARNLVPTLLALPGPRERIEAAVWAVFSRPARADEMELLTNFLAWHVRSEPKEQPTSQPRLAETNDQPLPAETGSDRLRRALAQMTWAMLMSPEFRFNH